MVLEIKVLHECSRSLSKRDISKSIRILAEVLFKTKHIKTLSRRGMNRNHQSNLTSTELSEQPKDEPYSSVKSHKSQGMLTCIGKTMDEPYSSIKYHKSQGMLTDIGKTHQAHQNEGCTIRNRLVKGTTKVYSPPAQGT